MKTRAIHAFSCVALILPTPRDDEIRIISARKANQREVTRYENHPHKE
jgi:uncharacterized DUF497 family protein